VFEEEELEAEALGGAGGVAAIVAMVKGHHFEQNRRKAKT
jgi:hypothetical protein